MASPSSRPTHYSFLILYFATLAALVIISAMTTLGGFVGAILALVTPFRFAADGVLYGVALLPAVLCFASGVRGRFYAPLLLLPVLLAFAIPLADSMDAKATFAQLDPEINPVTPVAPPQVIEFKTPLRGETRTPLDNAPCDAICQRLLFNHEADRVIETATREYDQNQTQISRVGYTLAARMPCPAAFGYEKVALPEVIAAAATGLCVVANTTETTAADVVVDTTVVSPAEKYFPRIAGLARHKVSVITTFDIVDERASPPAVIDRKVEVEAQSILLPADLVPAGRLDWRRKLSEIGVFDEAMELRHAVGYQVADVAGAPLSDMAVVEAVLMQPATGIAIGPELTGAFDRVFLAMSKQATLTSDDQDLAAATLAAHQVPRLSPVAMVLSKQPALLKQSLPAIIARLEAGDIDGDAFSSLETLLIRMPQADLAPLAGRLFAVAIKQPAQSYTFISHAGTLGIDPTPLFSVLAADPAGLPQAMAGICRADVQWGPELVPVAQGYLDGLPAPGAKSLPNEVQPALVALNRFGASDIASAFIARTAANGSARVANAIAHPQPANRDLCTP